ncbi:hypothetical protein [Nocardioides renjunii]|uniref:hypothetical protein n=1 Tax=Nocardioides renjunii TaxID=3095075 RepID=UPI002AFEB281|nr:hypothetical protein [Nocardioides sp. S-34]WQQ23315.1 hypothetical protein SHK17_04875 [Nocardioides sp. S-34]
MYAVPDEFRNRPFRRSEALESGITRGVLSGPQFRRLYDAVYCHRSLEPSFGDRLAAARLALPDEALTTGITRIQELGIDYGPRTPLHFVVQGDHHLALPDVFLHRTVKLPPNDDGAATAEAAYVAYCAAARLIDAIKVGCEMRRLGLLDLGLLDRIIEEEPWRRGVAETSYVLPHLSDRCRSLPEAELLAYVVLAGLPVPQVNRTIELAPGIEVTPDQWFDTCEVAIEYEGRQHQEERGQYNADIDRYRAYRRHGVAYELITQERLRTPRTAVRTVHAALVQRGYDGPAPDFGGTWEALFQPISRLVRPRIPRQR